jgi:O-antigen/teichoic acid export membrane protein
MNGKNKIISNFKFVASGDLLCRLIGFITVILLARYLGPEGYGKYSLIISFGYIFLIISNFGIDTLSIKDISKNKSISGEYSALHFILKPVLSIISIISLNLMVIALNYSMEIIICAALFSIHIIFVSLSEAICSIFKAHEKMQYSSLVIVINSFMGLIFIVILVMLKWNLTEIVVSRVLAYFIAFLVALLVLLKKFPKPNFMYVNYARLKKMVLDALPFFTIGIVYILYYKVDIIMLSKMKGEVYVGWYTAAANDLLFALFIIPRTVTTVLFPNFSMTFENSIDSFQKKVDFTLKTMMSLGIPIVTGIAFLAPQIINLAFGSDYENSVIVLRIVSIGIVAVFLRDVLGYALSAAENVRFVMKINIMALLLNILLNIFLIPLYAHYGAALSTTICYFVSFLALYYFFIYRVTTINIWAYLAKPILSSLIMFIFLYTLRYLNVLVLVAIGSVVYFSTMLLLKFFDDTELLMFRSAIANR